MMNIKIDGKKMFMSLKKAKGTTEQRLQRARELNLQFYDNLQKEFVDRKVTPAKFKSTISKTAGKSFDIDIENPNKHVTPPFSHCAGKSGGEKLDSYLFTIPRSAYFEDTINRSSAPTFLKITQQFFNEIMNPKFFKRAVALMNKSKTANVQMEFYEKNIAGKNELTEKRLDNLLKRTPAKIKIDTLQLYRYKLLSENNTREATPMIKKIIAKLDNIMFVNKGNDLSPYKFEEKMALLNKKLAEVLSAERAKIAMKNKN